MEQQIDRYVNFVLILPSLVNEYTILQSSEFFDARVLCAKKRVGINLHSAVCACSATPRAHALRLRLRRTGQSAFKAFMKQTVPACSLWL